MEDIELAFGQLSGKWFHPPGAVGLEVVRSLETIDPCMVLGTKLP
jgi:hypothetical protein